MRLRNPTPGWTYLVPARCSTQQQKWDDQIELNRAVAVRDRRRSRLLTRLGFTRWADRVWADTVISLAVADRMETCPNNPRNGGDGHATTGGGTWADRRPPGWSLVEDQSR